MTIIIPMAGKGERFSKKGYITPKPLIEVKGTPMVIKAVQDLPEGNKHIFIVLEDHLKKSVIDKRIQAAIPEAQFIVLDEVTEGQACTCMLAMPYVADKEEIIIGACDNGMIYNAQAFEAAKNEADVIIFTFRNNVTVVGKPQQYGWVKINDENKVLGVSVKKPISNKPIHDHAIIGAFWFKESGIFKKATQKMINENRRINNEFYVDECINDAIALGYTVKVFEVDKYICWGTPDDYETYNYWRAFFNNKNIFA